MIELNKFYRSRLIGLLSSSFEDLCYSRPK